MSSVPLLTKSDELAELIGGLRKEPILALDTEASGFHRYRERLCLIQLSTRERTYLVDPLAIEDLSPLGIALADPGIEWVIHDADYDLRMLKKLGGFRATNVFDTFVAAELLNEPELGLAANLKKHFGVVLNKKFQKADWSLRPLSSEMLAYAAMDTAHLIGLRDILREQLIARGRWHWAQEEFQFLVQIPFDAQEDPGPGFLRIKGARALKPKQLAVLRELHAWREDRSAQMDRAPFMVLGNDVMIDLSKYPPADMADLGRRKGVGSTTVQRYGTAVMEAITRGTSLPKEEWPRLERPKRWDRDDEYESRYERLRGVRERLIKEHDLQPGVVCANHLLGEIARLNPTDLEQLAGINGIRRWQVETFGAELLGAL